MSQQTRAKQERIVEALRLGLDGAQAVEFLHQSGFAMTEPGLARHLRALGGRDAVLGQVRAGSSNVEILQSAFPEEDLSFLQAEPPSQPELFEPEQFRVVPAVHAGSQDAQFETTKLTLKVPTDLYEAIRLAARAEGKKRNELVVDILTAALSKMPDLSEQGEGDEA